MQCTAHSKRTGLPCKSKAMRGKKVCRMHGGKSLSGIAHPNYQGLGKSKYLQGVLQRDFAEAIADPQRLANLTEDIALLEARMADVIRSLDKAASTEMWRTAQQAMTDLLTALRDTPPDASKQAAALQLLQTTLDTGTSNAALWLELAELIERKRRLVETETKRLIASQQYVRNAEVFLFVDTIANAIHRHITDPAILAAIQRDWDRAFAFALEPTDRARAGRLG